MTKKLPAGVRLICALFAITAVLLGAVMLLDIVAEGGDWKSYVGVAVLVFVIYDFGVTGALKGKWPILSFFA